MSKTIGCTYKQATEAAIRATATRGTATRGEAHVIMSHNRIFTIQRASQVLHAFNDDLDVCQMFQPLPAPHAEDHMNPALVDLYRTRLETAVA